MTTVQVAALLNGTDASSKAKKRPHLEILYVQICFLPPERINYEQNCSFGESPEEGMFGLM